MPIRENKIPEEVALVNSILLSIETCQTGYDVFVVLKSLLKIYHFEYFMVAKNNRKTKKPSDFEILITNWSQDFLLEYNQAIYNNNSLDSLYRKRVPTFLNLPQEKAISTNVSYQNSLDILMKYGRRLTAFIPVSNNDNETGFAIFSRMDETVDQSALIELTFYANLVFNKLLVVGFSAPIVTCPLNEREIQCVRLLSDGIALKKMADSLDLSVHTVTYHLNNAEKKLNAKSKTHLIAMAIRSGWIE